jgi:diamine N-acetyltransferase
VELNAPDAPADEAVTLQAVDVYNFNALVALQPAPGQEAFIAPNVLSIAQSKVAPNFLPLAIHHGDVVVGFLMFGQDSDSGDWHIVRLMIGAPYQRRGYARAALRLLIDQLALRSDCEAIVISYMPGNIAAERLYTSLGFHKTGEFDDEGEVLMRLALH